MVYFQSSEKILLQRVLVDFGEENRRVLIEFFFYFRFFNLYPDLFTFSPTIDGLIELVDALARTMDINTFF